MQDMVGANVGVYAFKGEQILRHKSFSFPRWGKVGMGAALRAVRAPAPTPALPQEGREFMRAP